MAGYLDLEGAEEHFGEGPAGYAGGGLAGGGSLEDVAGVGEVVLEGAGEVGVAGAGAGYGFVLGGVPFGHGEDLLPVFPVVVREGHGDGGADGFAVADSGEDVGGVLFDAHAAAAAVALLAAPEFVVEEGLVYGDARGQTAEEGYEGFAVAFAGCGETKHEGLIISPARTASSFARFGECSCRETGSSARSARANGRRTPS